MPLEEKRIYHIVGPIASLNNTQLGVNETVDADLGFRMWGGKDALGNVTEWLAKSKPGLLTTLALSGSSTVGEVGLLKHDAAGAVTGGLMTSAEFNAHISDGGLNVISAGPATPSGILVTTSAPNVEIQVKDAPANELNFQAVNGSIYKDSQSHFNHVTGPSKITGGVISANESAIDVTAGSGIAKATDASLEETYFFDWPASISLALTDADVNYVFVCYDVASPVVEVSVNPLDTSARDCILLGFVKKDGAELEFVNLESPAADLTWKLNRISYIQNEFGPQYGSGIIIGDGGTLHITCTAGIIFYGLSEWATVAVDTTGADTFTYYWTDDSGTSWTPTGSETQVTNSQYNDITTGLVALGVGKYGTTWLYMDYSGTHIHALYGRETFGSFAEAQDSLEPSVKPWQISKNAFLIGRVIVKNADTEIDTNGEITSSFLDALGGGASVSNHGNLSGLQGGSGSEYYHVTGAQHGVLTFNQPFTNEGLLFIDGGGRIAEDAANLYYDQSEQWVRIGPGTPSHISGIDSLYVDGSSEVTGSTYVGAWIYGDSYEDDGVAYFSSSKKMSTVTKFTYDESAEGLMIASQGVDGDRGLTISQHTTAGNSAYAQMKKSRGTLASPLSVVDSDAVGLFAFSPYVSSSGYIGTSYFGARVNGTVTGTTAPTELFFTASDATGLWSTNIKMLVKSDGVNIPDDIPMYFGSTLGHESGQLEYDSATDEFTIETNQIDNGVDAVLNVKAYTAGESVGDAILNLIADSGTSSADEIIKFDAEEIDINSVSMRNLLNASYGTSPSTSTYSAGQISTNWAVSKSQLTVTATGNVTSLSQTAPNGNQPGLILKITASGGDYTVGTLTGVEWAAGSDLSGAAAETIPDGDWMIITMWYDGTTYYGSYMLKA